MPAPLRAWRTLLQQPLLPVPKLPRLRHGPPLLRRDRNRSVRPPAQQAQAQKRRSRDELQQAEGGAFAISEMLGALQLSMAPMTL